MENTEMKKIIDRQRTFFQTGTTLDVSFRIAALKRLQHMIRRHEKEIEAALLLDLKKSSFESYMCETGLVLDETICSAISAHLQKSRMSEHRWHSSAPEATGNLLLTVSR
jgi:acyl-CoA reductase-like NAD-dependent aldehyde dehydrogenase